MRGAGFRAEDLIRFLRTKPRKLLIGFGATATAVLAITQLWTQVIGGEAAPVSGGIAIASHIDHNVTFADFGSAYGQAAPRAYPPTTDGDVFMATIVARGGRAARIVWTALDGGTSRPVTAARWLRQLGQEVTVRSQTTGPIYLWIPLPPGVCSYAVRFELILDGAPVGAATAPPSGHPLELSGPNC